MGFESLQTIGTRGQGWGRFWIGFIDGCLRNKRPEQKNLLAMAIDSDANEGGASRGPISRNWEKDRNPSVYPIRLRRIERLSRPVLGRYGLPVGRHERSEVTTAQGFPLVFTARPHMSFTVWLIGFFFTLGLAYLFQKILGRSYWRSWRSLSSGRWFSGTCFDEC